MNEHEFNNESRNSYPTIVLLNKYTTFEKELKLFYCNEIPNIDQKELYLFYFSQGLDANKSITYDSSNDKVKLIGRSSLLNLKNTSIKKIINIDKKKQYTKLNNIRIKHKQTKTYISAIELFDKIITIRNILAHDINNETKLIKNTIEDFSDNNFNDYLNKKNWEFYFYDKNIEKRTQTIIVTVKYIEKSISILKSLNKK